MGIPKRNQPKDEAEKGRPSLRRVFIVGWWWRPRGRRSRVQRRGSLDPRRHVGPTSRADSTAVGAGGTRGWLGWRADSGRLPLSVGMTGGARTRCWAGRVDRGAWKRSRPRVRWMRRRVVGEKN
ncbi:hypothetical protein DAI22_02g243466 [Oryza sativa Japonica Group]|nr:hypothetical protein DAI22_02g243466 [Oryza sativa Japonica Group]